MQRAPRFFLKVTNTPMTTEDFQVCLYPGVVQDLCAHKRSLVCTQEVSCVHTRDLLCARKRSPVCAQENSCVHTNLEQHPDTNKHENPPFSLECWSLLEKTRRSLHVFYFFRDVRSRLIDFMNILNNTRIPKNLNILRFHWRVGHF